LRNGISSNFHAGSLAKKAVQCATVPGLECELARKPLENRSAAPRVFRFHVEVVSLPLRELSSRRVVCSRKMATDMAFMEEALAEARASAEAGEVPIGAILVHQDKIIARSGNRTIRDCDPTAHSEIMVLREASRALGNYRLAGTTLYVTVEPCSMCAGAMIQARVTRLVYGCDDPKGGAVRSCFEIVTDSRLNHQVDVTSGIMASECAAILQAFFAARR
jgi:tRNA(adenine34) deaminase